MNVLCYLVSVGALVAKIGIHRIIIANYQKLQNLSQHLESNKFTAVPPGDWHRRGKISIMSF